MNVNSVLNTNQVNTTTNTKETKKQSNVSFDTYLEEATIGTNEVSLNDIFEKAAEKYNVPVNLLKAIGYCESSFQPNATSHCGAQGIMQLMPATAKSLGVTDAYDPEQNIMGGAKYISSLLQKYNGNTSLALAAYNAGSGNVAKYGGIPPFKETQNYVVKVTKYMNQELDADLKVVVGDSSNTSQGPQITNYTPVFEEVDEEDVISVEEKLDEIFSYDTYELLLKLLQEDEDSEKEQEQNTNLSQINMNPSVANLLKSASISL